MLHAELFRSALGGSQAGVDQILFLTKSPTFVASLCSCYLRSFPVILPHAAQHVRFQPTPKHCK
jgi:hypothetical protein